MQIERTYSKKEILEMYLNLSYFGRGAYGIQSGGANLIDGFEGCYYNIVGLPLFRTMRMLGHESTDCDCSVHPLQSGQAGCES